MVFIQKEQTALIYASQHGHASVVECLVQKRADVDVRNKVRNHSVYLHSVSFTYMYGAMYTER